MIHARTLKRVNVKFVVAINFVELHVGVRGFGTGSCLGGGGYIGNDIRERD